MLDGVLFFPVPPFGPVGEVDYDRLVEHIDRGYPHFVEILRDLGAQIERVGG